MQTHSNREQLTASYDWYRQMRETQPVFFDQKIQAWHIFCYDDVARVLSDHATFSSDEIGYMLFTPLGENERLIQEAGLTLVQTRDVTNNSAVLAKRWHEARARRRDELLQLEGEAEFEKTQRWLSIVHTQASERRLSRFAFVAQK